MKGFDQVFRAHVALRYVLYRSKRCRDEETFVPFKIVVSQIPVMKDTCVWGTLSETFGDRKMELRRHDVSKVVERKGALVRDRRLYLSFLIAAPKRPSYEIFVWAVRIAPKPKQAAIYQEPVPPFPVKVLLSVCVPNRKGLPCSEITSLL